jgi:hypothetical protein
VQRKSLPPCLSCTAQTRQIVLHSRSAVPANALVLASYGKTNPSLLRRRSPTITAESRADRRAQVGKQIKAEM